jgi:hypothetical protein
MAKKVFGPASEKQKWFLESDANIIVYGGKLCLHSTLS